MSKSAIYTANTGAQSVASGATLSLGNIVRRFGCALNLNGNGILMRQAGYYDVNISLTAAPTAAGTLTATLYKDGLAVPGATASAATSTAGNSVNLNIASLLRVPCDCSTDTLTVVLSGAAATVSNIVLVAEKI